MAQKPKKKRYTRRYTVNGQELTEEEFKDFSKRFDDIMNTAMGGLDKAMEGVDKAVMGGMDRAMTGVDRAMKGVDIAMEGVDKIMDETDESIDRTVRKIQKTLDDEAEKEGRDSMTSMTMKPKRLLYTFVTIWLAVFFLGFGVYFMAKAIHNEPNTKPEAPISTPLEEKTTQEKTDVLKKL